jgi:hypothetical protein|tara:strand:- start:55310 stop:55891 length:582 start_codon:yes stop_codon:yes gene_type:complete
MKKIISYITLIALFACGNSNDKNPLDFEDTNKSSEEKNSQMDIKYVENDSLDFIIQNPKGWDYDLGYKEADIVMYDDACDTCYFKSSITIVSYSVEEEATLDKISEQNMNELIELYLEFKLMEYSDLKLNGVPAQRVSYAADVDKNQSIGGIIYLVKNKTELYVISCLGGNKYGEFGKSVDFFDEICSTFKLK